MAFSVSPAVTVREFDLSGYVSNISITTGALGGVFKWGPVEEREFISSEQELVQRFGKPTSDNFETYFTAANFLAYSDKLYVSRAIDANAVNAAVGNGSIANTVIKNETDYDIKSATLDANAFFVAKYPGTLGNSLKVSMCDSANAFYKTHDGGTANLTLDYTVNSNIAVITIVGSDANNAMLEANTVISDLQVGDVLVAGNTTVGKQYLKVASIGATSNDTIDTATANVTFTTKYALSSDVSVTTLERYWEYYNSVDVAPGTSTYTEARGGAGDELHVVVVDEDGDISGTPNTILEIFEGLSRATDAKGEQGGSIYYKEALNNSSKYIWFANDRTGSVSNTAVNMAAIDTLPFSGSLTAGVDSVSESTISLANLATAYDQFAAAEEVDISVIMIGKSIGGVNGEGLANYVSDNIVDKRKDCVFVVSPQNPDVVNNPYEENEAMVAFRGSLRSTSYGFMDSGYKQQYDRYNDVYRWVPLNGDIAGTFARTDNDRDPWWSPAGYNRGQIKNVVTLAYNPEKADRDILYKNSINPVIHKGNSGTVLFGDKTLLNKTSAFDRINVRRLFIVLEKAISTASEQLLFEFNDSFTRAQFRNMVVPYLRDIQGRRGIYDFRVVCDETNNTGEIIDNNQFVGDIYIKPAKSINEIQLNFVALRTGAEFEEYIGRY